MTLNSRWSLMPSAHSWSRRRSRPNRLSVSGVIIEVNSCHLRQVFVTNNGIYLEFGTDCYLPSSANIARTLSNSIEECRWLRVQCLGFGGNALQNGFLGG